MNGILGNPGGMGTLSGRLRVERHGARALGVVALDADGVKKLQTNLNYWLALHGYRALAVDGALGGKTCGAATKSGMPAPVGCTTFTAPVAGSYPWNASSQDTRALQVALADSIPGVKVDSVLGPITCGAAKSLEAGGAFVPPTCQSFEMPAGAPATAPATTAAGQPVDWIAVTKYAEAVKAQNDARAGQILTAAQQADNAVKMAQMIAYATAVKAQNDKNAADMVAYAQAVKAAQDAGRKPPAARTIPQMRVPPKPKDVPPPPPPITPPPGVPDAIVQSASVEQAGMSNGTKLAIGVGAAAVLGYMMLFRKTKAVKAVTA